MSRHVLDEQVEERLYQELRLRMSIDKVGDGFGRAGWKDDRICTELHKSGKTFHTQDSDYYRPNLRHSTYCLVYYDVPKTRFVEFVRRFLRHASFKTHRNRMGKVIKVTVERIYVWAINSENVEEVEWE